jgi:hypothetical protein
VERRTYARVVRFSDLENHALEVSRGFGCDVEHECCDAASFSVGSWGAFVGGLFGAGCAAEFDVDVWSVC